jgi:hypothetical protein
MSKLPPHQLALFQRAAAGGLEVDGTTFLNVSDFSGPEIGQLEKGLWLAGVLKKGEHL